MSVGAPSQLLPAGNPAGYRWGSESKRAARSASQLTCLRSALLWWWSYRRREYGPAPRSTLSPEPIVEVPRTAADTPGVRGRHPSVGVNETARERRSRACLPPALPRRGAELLERAARL